jgi:hypothetical protein
VLIASGEGLLQFEARPTVDGPLGVGELTRYALSGAHPVTFTTRLIEGVSGVVAAAAFNGQAAFIGWKVSATASIACRMPFDMSEVPTCQALSGELMGADAHGLWVTNGSKLERLGVKEAGWSVQASLTVPPGWRVSPVEGSAALALARQDGLAGQVLVASRGAGAELASIGPSTTVLATNTDTVLGFDTAARQINFFRP